MSNPSPRAGHLLTKKLNASILQHGDASPLILGEQNPRIERTLQSIQRARERHS
jgi:hypothetical protein